MASTHAIVIPEPNRIELREVELTEPGLDDLVRGNVSIDTASLSDPVLIREDGAFLYTLPSVVDDIDFKITHIVRGEDHVTNSGVQIEIFEALGGPVPMFGHFPLLVGADGNALSKRIGSLGVGELAAEGYEPMTVLSHLAKIGTSDPVEARASLDVLASEFDFAKIGRAPARFDPEDLKRVNAQLLHQYDYAKVKDRLAKLEADKGEAFWNAIRANIQHLYDHVLGESYDLNDNEITEAYNLFVTIWKDGKNGVAAGTYSPDLGNCRASNDYWTGADLAENAITQDPDYTVRAWMGVLTYMLSDYKFLHE